MKVDCYFDFTCEYSYRMWSWFERLKEALPELDVTWRPFVLKEVNREVSESSLLSGPRIESVAVLALALAEAATPGIVADNYRARMFAAMHRSEERPGQEEVFGVAEEAGLDISRFQEGSARLLDSVRVSHESAASDRGIFGHADVGLRRPGGDVPQAHRGPGSSQGPRTVATHLFDRSSSPGGQRDEATHTAVRRGRMKSETVRDPSGRQWRVSVRMLPWGVRWRGPGTRKASSGHPDEPQRKPRWYDALDIPDVFGGLDDGFGGFVALVFVLVAIVVAILFVLPLFIFLIELLIVALLVVGAILLRVVFRQPWLVDAVADDGTHMTWKVVGYRTSRRVVGEIGSLISKGTTSPTVHDAVLVR